MRGPRRHPHWSEAGSPAVRRWVGAFALLVLAVLFARPLLQSALFPAVAESPAPAPNAEAIRSVQELQAASEALKDAAAKSLASSPSESEPKAPEGTALAASAPSAVPAAGLSSVPPPTDPASECLQSFVPEGTFGPGRLDWACAQPNLWQVQLDLYGRAATRGTGQGASLWLHLGRFELGAIAIMRTACCPGGPAFTADVATKRCGSLQRVLADLAGQPSPERIQRYDETMQCLADRSVWFPEGWKRVSYEQSRRYFEEFLEPARRIVDDVASRAALDDADR